MIFSAAGCEDPNDWAMRLLAPVREMDQIFALAATAKRTQWGGAGASADRNPFLGTTALN